MYLKSYPCCICIPLSWVALSNDLLVRHFHCFVWPAKLFHPRQSDHPCVLPRSSNKKSIAVHCTFHSSINTDTLHAAILPDPRVQPLHFSTSLPFITAISHDSTEERPKEKAELSHQHSAQPQPSKAKKNNPSVVGFPCESLCRVIDNTSKYHNFHHKQAPGMVEQALCKPRSSPDSIKMKFVTAVGECSFCLGLETKPSSSSMACLQTCSRRTSWSSCTIHTIDSRAALFSFLL